MIQVECINYILDSQDSSFITENGLDNSFFSAYKDEFDFIKNHIDTYGNTPDKRVFFEKFPKMDNYIVHETPQYLLDELYNQKRLNLLATGFNDIRDLSLSGEVDAACAQLNTLNTEIQIARHVTAVDLLQDTNTRYQAYIDKMTDYSKYYIRTGFKELDNIIGGWDRNEELVTVAARTNQGKSWILIRMAAEAVIQGLRVGFYSGEMSEIKVGYRLDTQLASISNSALIHGDGRVQNVYQSYLEMLHNKYPNSVFKVLTPVRLGGPATISDLRAFIERDQLDILFVDQHSLLEDERKAKTPVEKASNISKDLKNLQVMKKIPIITASQQNRTSTENGVGTEHIAQSDRIAQDSTIIIFFEQDKEQSMITLHLTKSRDSVHQKDLKYAFDFDKGKYNYIDEGNEVQIEDDEDGCDPNYNPTSFGELDIF